jgi:adenylate cyclase
MIKLTIKKFDGTEEGFSPVEEVSFIGRNDPASGIVNHINLPDSAVSRRHAKIIFENFDYYIEDLGSVNGTWLNDQKIKKAKLSPGDQIGIGRNNLIFESQGTKILNPVDFMVKEVPKIDHHKTVDSNYFILHQLSKLLITQNNLSDFLSAVMKMVLEGVKSEHGAVILTDYEGNIKQAITSPKDMRFSEDVIKQVVTRKKSLLIGYDFEASKTMMVRGVHSAICAPLLTDEKVLGTLYLEDPLPGRFGEEDLIILTLFANQTAAGIESMILRENLQNELKIRSNLERFLSPRIAELIIRDCLSKGELLLKTERVNGTILFSDIQGFTRLSENLDPDEVAELLSRYFSMMTDIVFDHEGTVDKYVGDGLLAVFGAPFPYADHPLRAVAAAVQMLQHQKRFAEDLPPEKRFAIRIGVNTGEIVAGYMGAPKRMEYTVLGEPVIIAQRLESLADPDTVYLGRATYLMVKDRYPAEFIAKIATPKGRKEMEIYKLSP